MTRPQHQTMAAFFTACLLVSSGCGDDGGTPTDTGTPVDTGGGGDAGDTGTGGGDTGTDGGMVDCAAEDDGTACGGNLICVGGSCQPSSCGDGFVDADAGEACDDGNSVPGDGCEPESCQLSCEEDVNCDDGDPCNGAETCNIAQSRCQAGTPEPGAACTQESGEAGVCAGMLCAAPGCGNGVVDGDEECDDSGNGDNADGCRDDCQFTCDAETPCADGNACNGDEVCNDASHTCTPGTAPNCNDRDACTADSCEDASGCVNTLIDGDGDGFAPGTCRGGSTHMGGDCDDADPTAYPGAPEACDGVDNDCDSRIDNDTVDIVCQRDADGDGYGNAADTMTACSCPSGYIPPHPGGNDCQDGNAAVNPGVTAHQTTYYCPGGTSCDRTTGSYDWNCSGSEEQQYTTVSRGSCSFDCSGRFCVCTGGGWTSSTVPACGDPRFFILGVNNYRSCGPRGFVLCDETMSQRRQACR